MVAIHKYTLSQMSSLILQSENCIFTQSEFINEITSSHSDHDSYIGKRLPQASSSVNGESSLKALVVGKSSYKLSCASVTSTQTSNHDYTNYQTSSEVRQSLKHQENDLSVLLNDQLACHKKIVKHFLIETVMNEKFNLQRFNYLPAACQSLALTFLERHFRFSLEDELKKGSSRKYLFPLEGRTYQTACKSPIALPFLTDCYVYGLLKQLHQNSKQVSRREAILILKDKLVESGAKLDQKDFCDAIESLLQYESSEIANLQDKISNILLNKMIQIKESTLAKYYGMKVIKTMSELIDDCKTHVELRTSMSQSSFKTDILSAYLGKTLTSVRYYQSTSLNLI